MKKRNGLSLLELSLTLTLVSIILMSVYKYSETHHFVCKRLRDNNTAIYLLESIRNKVQLELEHGASPEEFSSEMFKALIDRESWYIGLELVNEAGGRKLVVSLFDEKAESQPCTYVTEVKLP